MTTLVQSPVIFLPEKHQYFNPEMGKYLSGITSMLSRQLFDKKYEGIPKSTLDAAAEKGSIIHAECADLAMFGTKGKQPETAAFGELLKAYKISPLEAEYTVSDGEYYASKIDLVDNELNLYDIKTTSTLDKEYVSWQLSVYAYLFEQQNPGVPSGDLFAIHLRDKKAKLVKVQKKPSDVVSRLLTDDLTGKQFTTEQGNENALTAISGDDTAMQCLIDSEQAIISLKQQIDSYETRKKEALSCIQAQMEKAGLYKVETPLVAITRVPESQVVSFDSAAFKKEHEDMFGQYLKSSTRKGYVKITLKQTINQ